ncbi:MULTISPECIES: helix-turn-helix domain-containing protein [unclassified Meiothermus]|uniref:helix-turn-helix domain-containing protein n=1 Tax=unclassified Meiothermus TaxID=370471 RepID=UPI001F220CFF|nr:MULTISPECIES: helix-turn-helix domain-containing protein [unclassified Meiothermus]
MRGYNQKGPGALKDRRHQNPGQKPKLTPQEQERVLEALKGPPPDGGLWTGPKLRDWVERELGADAEAQEMFKKTPLGVCCAKQRRGPTDRGGG